jgi:hypothetical protein
MEQVIQIEIQRYSLTFGRIELERFIGWTEFIQHSPLLYRDCVIAQEMTPLLFFPIYMRKYLTQSII